VQVVLEPRGIEREAQDEAQRQLAEQQASEAATTALPRRTWSPACVVLMLVATAGAGCSVGQLAKGMCAADAALAQKSRGDAESCGLLIETSTAELAPPGWLDSAPEPATGCS
jgi:hypothetical protein